MGRGGGGLGCEWRVRVQRTGGLGRRREGDIAEVLSLHLHNKEKGSPSVCRSGVEDAFEYNPAEGCRERLSGFI